MSLEKAKTSVEKIKTDKEELDEVNGELQNSDLDSVNGGAIPTAVNGQITDAVT